MRNTSRVGDVTVLEVMRALASLGKDVLLPFGENKRYDLGIDEADGGFTGFNAKQLALLAIRFNLQPAALIPVPSQDVW
jgi:hypothetical protein